LFYVENINEDQLDDRDDNDVLLIDLNECLDPLPDDWLTEEKWPRVFEYFDSNGKLKEGVYQSPYPTEPYELYHAPLPISLEERFEKNKIKEITPDEAKTITQLVRSILKYDPNERPTAEELLNHPFFQDEKVDGEKETSE
jgi:serine/threonine protein kinase